MKKRKLTKYVLDGRILKDLIFKYEPHTIVFSTTGIHKNILGNATLESLVRNGSLDICGWYENGFLYVASDTPGVKIRAPKDCSKLIGEFPDLSTKADAITSLTEINVIGLDVSNTENFSYMFAGAGRDSESFKLTGLKDFNMENATDTGAMFYLCGYHAEIFEISDISNWNMSNVHYLNRMFKQTAPNAEWFLNCSKWTPLSGCSHYQFTDGTFFKIRKPKWI